MKKVTTLADLQEQNKDRDALNVLRHSSKSTKDAISEGIKTINKQIAKKTNGLCTKNDLKSTLHGVEKGLYKFQQEKEIKNEKIIHLLESLQKESNRDNIKKYIINKTIFKDAEEKEKGEKENEEEKESNIWLLRVLSRGWKKIKGFYRAGLEYLVNKPIAWLQKQEKNISNFTNKIITGVIIFLTLKKMLSTLFSNVKEWANNNNGDFVVIKKSIKAIEASINYLKDGFSELIKFFKKDNKDEIKHGFVEATGAGAGAFAGSLFGPVGALVGAGVGAGVGAITTSFKNKDIRKKNDIEAIQSMSIEEARAKRAEIFEEIDRGKYDVTGVPFQYRPMAREQLKKGTSNEFDEVANQIKALNAKIENYGKRGLKETPQSNVAPINNNFSNDFFSPLNLPKFKFDEESDNSQPTEYQGANGGSSIINIVNNNYSNYNTMSGGGGIRE